MTTALRPAAAAFDAIASVFDEKFGAFLSVAAQRRAVRSALLRAFPSGGRILELGGGTGEDAGFLAERGYHVLLTDPSPEMVRIAQTKLAQLGSKAKVASGEELHLFAEEYLSQGEAEFDGVFSNFAPLNCVADLGSVAHALARLMKPGAPAMLVLFGTLCPGEMVTEIVRGRPPPGIATAYARRSAGTPRKTRFPRRVSPKKSDRSRLRSLVHAGTAHRNRGRCPPKAQPSHGYRIVPRLLRAMERMDRVLASPLATLGDHVLYQFRRTDAPATEQ